MSDEITELRALLESTNDDTNPRRRPIGTTPEDLDRALDRQPTTWEPIDLTGPIEEDAPPSLLAVRGASSLLYSGRTNSIIGESESGKSWIALHAATEVLARGGRVLWIDYEDNVRTFRGRLDALSIPDEDAQRIHYLNPSKALYDHHKLRTSGPGYAALVELCREYRYELAVIDTMTGAMSVEGLDPDVGTDVEATHRVLMGTIARESGATVLVLDHVPKSKDNRGRYAIGSERKLSVITGAAYVVEVTRPVSRALGPDPILGSANLKVTKDRPGFVRGGRSELSTVAVVEMTAYPDGGLTVRLVSPKDTVTVPSIDLLHRILDRVRRDGPITANALHKDLGGNRDSFLAAIDHLRDTGALDAVKNGRGQYLTVNELRVRELGYD